MNHIPPRTLTRATVLTRRTPRLSYSTNPRPSPQPQPPSKVIPTVLLLTGGGAAGLGAYYYYDPNAEVFKQAKSVLGLDQNTKQSAAPEKKEKKVLQKQPPQQEQKKPQVVRNEQKPPPEPKPAPVVLSPPVPPLISAAAAATAAASVIAPPPIIAAPPTPPPQEKKEESVQIGDSVPKHVLITAMRAQQEALTESHESKIKVIQSEYDRKLNNATQVIEAERVVDLRAKYEKASAALQAIEQGIEARTTQNTRAKRLRSLWAQVNALHARVNHPEYHDSTTTSIDKSRLIAAIEVPDKFVTQMVGSLPSKPVHSLESLKKRFYDDLEPVAKSVTLIKDGEGFSVWKYALGKVFGGAIAHVNRSVADDSSPPPKSPVQLTANALDSARSALERSDLLSAAIAVNQLRGLPRQVASDWLADARTLLETNQTLFVLMTYAASNNVF